MINLDYAFHHLESVIGVIAGRPGALERMDISSDGFWRSFSAIIVALPALFFGWVIGAVTALADTPSGSLASLIARDAVLESVAWFLPIAVFAVIVKPLGFGARFAHLIVVRNWSNALFSYVLALYFIALMVLPASGTPMLLAGIVLIVGMLFAAVRLVRAALACSRRVAIAFVGGELAMGIALIAVYASAASAVSGGFL